MRVAPHGMLSPRNQSASHQLPHETGHRSFPNAAGITPGIPPCIPRTPRFTPLPVKRLRETTRICRVLWRNCRENSNAARLSLPHGTAKLARGTFAVSFFLACLAALELDGVRLDDI